MTQKAQIRMKIENGISDRMYVPKDFSDSATIDRFTIRLRYKDKKFSTPYFQHRNNKTLPTVNFIVNMLFEDYCLSQHGFNDFCLNLGFDPLEDEEAKSLYRATIAQSRRWKEFLGSDFEDFLELYTLRKG